VHRSNRALAAGAKAIHNGQDNLRLYLVSLGAGTYGRQLGSYHEINSQIPLCEFPIPLIDSFMALIKK
jgi:hypothetical protein